MVECSVYKCILAMLSCTGPPEFNIHSDPHGIYKQICFVGNIRHRAVMGRMKQSLCIPVIHSPDGSEYLDTNLETIFILDDFENLLFQKIITSNSRILGVTYVKEMIDNNIKVDAAINPMFCHAMSGMTIGFTGFECQTIKTRLTSLVGYMGGKVSTEVNSSTTILVSNCCWSDEIKHAHTYNIPIVMHEWIHFCWGKRHKVGFSAGDILDDFKVKCFSFSKIFFYGFDQGEQNLLKAVLLENGGSPTGFIEKDCTHVVIKEFLDDDCKNLATSGIFVNMDWFWISVQQNCFVNPREYMLERVSSIPFGELFDQAMERIEETISVSGLADDDLDSCTLVKSPRALDIMEFIETETNYVSILDIIVQIKNEAACTEKKKSCLLNITEVKSIFSGIESIQKLHHSLLNDLEEFRHADEETFPIGKILLKHAPEMSKVYPPFVNFFERAMADLQCCESQNSRFRDYLLSWQKKPECGRQSLREFMIRPVQRLGSINLLVKRIYKHTDNSNIDYPYLKKAINQILEAVSSIDKDKERTQNMCHIFDIFNSIEECPPNLISSSRTLLFELKAIDVNGFEKCGHLFQLFVFSDLIEVSKIKTGCHQPSPKYRRSNKRLSWKTSCGTILKHYMVINFTVIHGIIDFIECESIKDTFGIMIRELSGKDKVMCFSILQAEITKKDDCILQLCKAIAVNRCIKDPMSILYEAKPLDPKAVNSSGFSWSSKALNVFKSPISHAMNLCNAPVNIKKDVLSFLHFQDSLKSDTKSSSCTELVETITYTGSDVVRSLSLTEKIMKKL